MRLRPTIAGIAAAAVLLTLPTELRGGSTLWFVAGSLGSDLNPCNAPNLPCDTINAAIAKAQPGEEIRVTGGGVYVGTDPLSVVHIDKSLTLSGGWDPTFTQRPYYTVIDGEHNRRGIDIDAGADVNLEQVAVLYGDALLGGGLYVGGGLWGRRLLIAENRGYYGGGIYFAGRTGDELFLIDSVLIGNLYWARGGGLYVSGKRVFDGAGTTNEAELWNVTVSNNVSVGDLYGQPARGAGVYLESGNLATRHATFAENTIWDGHKFTQTQAGIFRDLMSTASFLNTLVADGCDASIAFQFQSGGNNLERGNTCFFTHPGDRVNVNPLIYPPDVAPGPYTTITHPLAPGSPAIDTANGGGGFCLFEDQRGMSRPQGVQCDIGAFERASTDPIRTMMSHPGVGFANGERCQPLEWNPEGRERPNQCRVDIDVLVQEAIRRGFPPVTAPPGGAR